MKMSWEVVIQTAMSESREDRSNKVCKRRSHQVTAEGIAHAKVSKEEKRRGKLPNQGNHIVLGNLSTWSEIHRANGIIRTTNGNNNHNHV